MLYGLLPSALQFLIASLLWNEEPARPQGNSLTFELRHEHAVTDRSLLVFSDVPKFRQLAGEDDRLQYSVKTKTTQSHVFSQFLDSWDDFELPGPNVTDRETLHTLATMTSNAYFQDPKKKGWYDLGPDWNSVGFWRISGCYPERTQFSRRTRLAGNPTRMDSGATSTCQRTTAPWSSPSKGPQLSGSSETAVLRSRRIN